MTGELAGVLAGFEVQNLAPQMFVIHCVESLSTSASTYPSGLCLATIKVEVLNHHSNRLCSQAQPALGEITTGDGMCRDFCPG